MSKVADKTQSKDIDVELYRSTSVVVHERDDDDDDDDDFHSFTRFLSSSSFSSSSRAWANLSINCVISVD